MRKQRGWAVAMEIAIQDATEEVCPNCQELDEFVCQECVETNQYESEMFYADI